MMKQITSATNAKIKLAAALERRKRREETGLCIAEGVRLCEMAAASDWRISFGLCTAAAAKNARVRRLLAELEKRQAEIFEVSEEIYKKAAATVEPQGVMLVLEQKQSSLQSLAEAGAPLWVVLDGVQDPGNAGTIIRTADAAGCTAVILLDGAADAFNAKTLRSGMGSHFHLPVVTHVTQEELLAELHKREMKLWATALDAEAQPHFAADYRQPCAIVFGNEGNGISAAISDNSAHVFIPMRGQTESLNVAGAAAVVLYETMRQRYYN